jgi:hypothetical protein
MKPKRFYGSSEEHYCGLCGEFMPRHDERCNQRFEAIQSIAKAAMVFFRPQLGKPSGGSKSIREAMAKLNALTKGKS